ncbi:MAG: amidohydrolase [Gammaproteobacteria bacterium]|nr:amidohydrolase [Gammaproteobacteria bacterium]NNL51449.1 amidohydrolase [Woeseiaceae bacterium]
MLGLIAACVSACTPGVDSTSTDVADAIYHGGTILTMNGTSPTYVDAVAVKNGVIVHAGDKDGAMAMRGSRTAVRDLAGKSLLPGFIDPHGHFVMSLNMISQVNVSSPPVGPVTNIPGLIAEIQAFKDRAGIADDDWIVGWGYDQEELAEGRHVTIEDLDPHFPNNKVILIHVSNHGAVLNSKALAEYGIDETTETPFGGVINRLPGTNAPAGLLMETAWLPVVSNMPVKSGNELLEVIEDAQQLYASEGYTQAQDSASRISEFSLYQRASAQGLLYIDIVALGIFTETEAWLAPGAYSFGQYDGHLKLQGIKWAQDGSPQGKTALMSAPYLTGGPDGEEDWYGKPIQPKSDLIAQVHAALKTGIQVFIHANGDAAIDHAIEAIEAAGVTAADDRRPIIIHSQFQRPEQIDQYARLGISPSYFTNHTYFWGDVHLANRGPAQTAFISPLKSITEAGIPFSNHADFNVTPLDPFFILWTAMARESRNGTIIGPEQRVDAYQALRGLTTGPAWQVFEENRKGMIKEGLLADFVVLSANPVETSVDDIRDIEVLETIKEGITIFPR